MAIHIAVDMDDVMVDFVGGLLAAVKKEYGVTITEEQVTDWNLHPLLDPIIGYSWWDWMKKRQWLWANFPAVDGAIGSIDYLRAQGHYMELLTSKPDWARHNVWKWLGKWQADFDRVTIVPVTDSKTTKVFATDATLIIDDKPANCEGFLQYARDAILFDRPHNLKFRQDMTDPSKAMRHAANWREVIAQIEEYHGRKP